MIIYEPKKRENLNVTYSDREHVYNCYVKYNIENVNRNTILRENHATGVKSKNTATR